MKLKTYSLVAALAVLLSPVFNMKASAEMSQPDAALSESPMLIAQNTANNCRVPNRIQDVYSDPSIEGFSRTLLTVQQNTPFYVDRNQDGSLVLQNGFARGRTGNTTGWMITRYLTSIPGCGETPPQDRFCARSLVDLTVRSEPRIGPNVLGPLYARSVVQIRNESYDSSTGRTWIQFPYSSGLGWVAETGGFGGGRNFEARYRCNQ